MTTTTSIEIIEGFKFFSVTKMMRNPVEFCMNLSATKIPSNYSGIFIENISNENINVQNQECSRNGGEGTSRGYYVAVDNDGHDIDLNLPPKSV